MSTVVNSLPRHDLSHYGLEAVEETFWNLGPAQLLEHAIIRGEGILAVNGAFIVNVGRLTKPPLENKFIVRDTHTEDRIDWSAVNQPMSPDAFDRFYRKLTVFLAGSTLFAQDCLAGADPRYAQPIRVLTTEAWHSLLARQLFIRAGVDNSEQYVRPFTLVFAPNFNLDPDQDGAHGDSGIAINFNRRLAFIAGAHNASELKNTVFTILSDLLLDQGVLPVRGSASIGKDDKSALFLGLSGTGKTTLSIDPARKLIGDDEHGWSSQGVFNIEGGCHTQCAALSKENQPEIWNAIRFGTVLENVNINEQSREIGFDTGTAAAAAFPIDFIECSIRPSVGPQPSDIVLLTGDASGILPPISKLTPELAIYHFLSGYTSEFVDNGYSLDKEPVAIFSACFGEGRLLRNPHQYAKLLGERLRANAVRCWLVNTGWIGGPYGVGERMKLRYTRAMVNAALDGLLDDVECNTDTVFGLSTPRSCPGVPSVLLDPRGLWSDREAYDKAARELYALFTQNFEKFRVQQEELLPVS